MGLPAMVFILANDDRLVYFGYTKDLEFALYLARSDGLCPMQKASGLVNLVYFEQHSTVKEAIERVEELESWSLEKTQAFIDEVNPNWLDLGVKESQIPAGSYGGPTDFVKQVAKKAERLRAEELYLGMPPIEGDEPASGGIRAKLPTGPKFIAGHDAKPWPKPEIEGS